MFFNYYYFFKYYRFFSMFCFTIKIFFKYYNLSQILCFSITIFFRILRFIKNIVIIIFFLTNIILPSIVDKKSTVKFRYGRNLKIGTRRAGDLTMTDQLFVQRSR